MPPSPPPALAAALGVARAGRLIDRTLRLVRAAAVPGTTVGRLDALTRCELAAARAVPAMLGYRDALSPDPFPAALSVSVNDQIAGGSDPTRVLRPGDLVTADLALALRGWHADAALTWVVPGIPQPARHALAAAARSVTLAGCRACTGDAPWLAVCRTMAREAARLGVVVLRGYDAHGVGPAMHAPPRLPTHPEDLHRLDPPGLRLQPGMIITVEPVVARTDSGVARDGWLERTADGSDACFVEATVLVGRRAGLVLAGNC